MTSNVGAKAITESRCPMGFAGDAAPGDAAMRSRVMEELRATFRPEFLNRVDETIVFHRLGREELTAITENLVREVEARFSALGLSLRMPGETLRFLADTGCDEIYGARPLRRAVQHSLEDQAAELLLEGRARPGDTLCARIRDGKVELAVQA